MMKAAAIRSGMDRFSVRLVVGPGDNRSGGGPEILRQIKRHAPFTRIFESSGRAIELPPGAYVFETADNPSL